MRNTNISLIKQKRNYNLIRFLIVSILCLIQIVPIYITLMVSLRPMQEVASFWRPPTTLFIQNFIVAIEATNLPRAFFNTAVITAGATLGILLFSTMAAYPIARNPSRLNRAVRIFILSIMMVPALSLLVPLYVLLLRFGWLNRHHGIIFVHLAFHLPLAVFMFSNFIKTIPSELDEAALIDGCSVYSIFFRIIFPMLKPVVVSVVILTAIPVWNDFQYSVYFLTRSSMNVITLAVASFFQQTGSNPNVAAAAAIMVVIPLIVMYLILQKYFIKGMVDGAIK